jgi:DNA-binding PadR family transcriptional regulator
MRPEELKGHLDALLLAVIAAEPAHGYAIVERLRERSGGAFDLPEGTVYPALHRLEKAGLLRSRWAPGATRRRRVYEVTARGRRALGQRLDEWRDFAHAVDSVLNGVAPA